EDARSSGGGGRRLGRLRFCRSGLGPGAAEDADRGAAARDRPPGRERLPARAHAGSLQARHRAGGRLHRARSRRDPRRRFDRAPRADARRHHRRRRSARIRRPQADPQGRRRGQDGFLCRRLHPGRDQAVSRQASHARARPGP
ncbi:MAG: Glycerophosphoryl diester phosphodiesterase, partial [uncultured Microvirga sp.]